MTDTRILVAESDPALCSTMTGLLTERGYEVALVAGRDDVFEQLERRPPDLVVLDDALPQTDSAALIARMRGDERWRDIPVLQLSSLPDEEATVRALAEGASDCLPKPIRERELLARIEAQLRLRGELRTVRCALRATEEALARAREENENRRKLVDILQDVTGELSPEEIYRILARRVARALNISRCSVILARPSDDTGMVVAACENPGLRNFPIHLDRYPEIRQALRQGAAVLVEDAKSSPIYAGVREQWESEGLSVRVRSAIAVPFTLSGPSAGVFLLRTMGDEAPLSAEDADFAETVIRAAVAAVQRAHLLEMTRADRARLETLASTDPLTQLLNRRALLDRLIAEMDRASRYAAVVSLLMVDVDHFKQVNDGYGHLVGDEVLRELARLLQASARSVDVVARYGGEEFVVLLPETGREGAITFAERLRQRVEGHAFGVTAQGALHLTASVGVATFPSHGVTTTEELLARADAALYRAKGEGRNRVGV